MFFLPSFEINRLDISFILRDVRQYVNDLLTRVYTESTFILHILFTHSKIRDEIVKNVY